MHVKHNFLSEGNDLGAFNSHPVNINGREIRQHLLHVSSKMFHLQVAVMEVVYDLYLVRSNCINDPDQVLGLPKPTTVIIECYAAPDFRCFLKALSIRNAE